MANEKRGCFIPVNNVPNEDELLGINPENMEVKESTAHNSSEAPAVPEGAQISFVWGFLFFDMHEIYAEGNKIFFNGEVTKGSMEELKRTLIYVSKRTLMAYHELGIHDTSEMKIELHINSPGGCMSSGWAMIDFIDTFYMPVHTYATGTVASMGVMLLLAGARRFVTPNTHLLVHQFSAGVQGKRQLIMDYIKHFENIQKQSINFISKHTNLSASDVAALLDHETWMPANEAVKKGFAEAIK